MGCDIHGIVEGKFNGEWQTIEEFIDDRNYDMFAILADVRNGFGFAGAPSGEGFQAISSQRGLPADFKPPYNYWMGDHSFTWVTLTEMLLIPFDKKVTKYGLMRVENYKKWDRKSRPTEYCLGAGGPNVVVISEADFISGVFVPMYNANIYISVSWVETYAEALGPVFMDWLEEAKLDAEKCGGTDNIRLVMGFDS